MPLPMRASVCCPLLIDQAKPWPRAARGSRRAAAGRRGPTHAGVRVMRFGFPHEGFHLSPVCEATARAGRACEGAALVAR